MTDQENTLSILFQVNEVVAKSTDLEECILEIIESELFEYERVALP
jgi:hypothetical protein